MLIIPFELRNHPERGPVVVVMILEKENLDRMKEADPFDLKFSVYGNVMNIHHPISKLDLVIAYEEQFDKVMDFKKTNDILGLLTWLERGRTIQPGEPSPPVPYRKN
jgi:hypothetical protein